MKNAWCAWLDWQISADYEGYIYKWTLVEEVDVACDLDYLIYWLFYWIIYLLIMKWPKVDEWGSLSLQSVVWNMMLTRPFETNISKLGDWFLTEESKQVNKKLHNRYSV